LVLLRNEAFRYDPDLILWSYCLNDPAHPVYHNVNGSLGRYYHRPRSYVISLLDRAWFRVQRKLRNKGCPREFHAFLHCAYAPEIRHDLGTIHDVSAEHGVPVLLLIHPVFEPIDTFDDEYSLANVHEWLREAAGEAGLIPVDLLAAFGGKHPDDLKIHREDYYDPWHLNVAGHRLTARAIYEVLAARFLR
jgi:hypothetical protein